MHYESSEDSSNQLDGPMESPRRPPRTPKQLTWPHWITLTALQMLTHKTPDPLGTVNRNQGSTRGPF